GFVRTASDVANLIKGLHVGLPLGGVLSRIPVINNIFLLPGLKSALLPKPGDKEGIGAVMGVSIILSPQDLLISIILTTLPVPRRAHPAAHRKRQPQATHR